VAGSTGGAAASGAASAPAAGQGFLSSAGSWLGSHPQAALAALGLGMNLMKGDQKPAFQGNLEGVAGDLSAQGKRLGNYLQSGTLPPGVGASLQAAHDAAAATIRSRYAARGQSGSSAEAADLSNLANTTVTQGASIASNLLSQGISEQQFAGQIYSQLMQASIAQDKAFSDSIARFSGALAGSAMRG
jgi:hypothetical protein